LAVVRALLVGPDGFLKHDVRQRLRRDKPDAQGGVAGLPGLNEETSQGDALAATEDDVLTGTDAVDQSDLKRVSEVRQTLSSGLAAAPSVSDACESLNIDPAALELKMGEDMTLWLKAYQVTGIAWMKEQERVPIKEGNLADDCGLGKTTQALAMIMRVVDLPFGGSDSEDTAFFTSAQNVLAGMTRSTGVTRIRLLGDHGDG
jgi:hypothetical protein